jgi:hypothetical protein
MPAQGDLQKDRKDAQKDLTVSTLIVTERTEMDFLQKIQKGAEGSRKGFF